MFLHGYNTPSSRVYTLHISAVWTDSRIPPSFPPPASDLTIIRARGYSVVKRTFHAGQINFVSFEVFRGGGAEAKTQGETTPFFVSTKSLIYVDEMYNLTPRFTTVHDRRTCGFQTPSPFQVRSKQTAASDSVSVGGIGEQRRSIVEGVARLRPGNI